MENSLSKKNVFSPILKGVLVALCVSLVGILVFAIFLRFVNLNGGIIKVVNQIIKVLSIFFGILICLKKDSKKGFFKGLLIGALYTILSYAVFSILVSSFSFGPSMFFDLLFLSIVGMICGVIVANLKR